MDFASGLFSLVSVGLFVLLFIQISNLRREVELLKEGGKPTRTKSVSVKKVAQKKEAHALQDLWAWLKEDFLMKAGAFLVLLALAWFVRYAFINDWVGPEMRIALGYIASAGVLLGGYWTMKKRRIPGEVLMVLGETGVLLTTFAAREYYDFLSPGIALGLMAVMVTVMGVVAVRNDRLSLGLSAFVGGLIAPLLTVSPEPDFIVLNSYLLLLTVGGLAMVITRDWKELMPLMIFSIFFYTLPFESLESLKDSLQWLFIGLFFVLFLAGELRLIWVEKKEHWSHRVSLLFLALVSFFWNTSFVPNDYQGYLLILLGFFVVSVMMLFYERKRLLKNVYRLGLTGLFLLGAGTLVEFDAHTLVLVLALEALLLVLASAYLIKDKLALMAVFALTVLPFVFSIDFLAAPWEESLLNWNAGVILGMALLFTFVAKVVMDFRVKQKRDQALQWSERVAVGGSVFYAFALIWRGFEFLLPLDYAHGLSLVIYSLFGLALFFMGVVRVRKDIRWGGALVLGLVLLRLLLVEVWSMSLIERTLTFVVIGVLFIMTAFFERKTK